MAQAPLSGTRQTAVHEKSASLRALGP